MPNLIAIANFIGINQYGVNPPYGGQDIITELKIQMVSENGTDIPNSDLITEQAP